MASLTLTPLFLQAVHLVDVDTGRLWVSGLAIQRERPESGIRHSMRPCAGLLPPAGDISRAGRPNGKSEYTPIIKVNMRNGEGKPAKLVSILTACYNEQFNVEEVYERVRKVMARTGYRYEHIFIDNSSTDDTVGVLKSLAAKDANVKIIVNARNFGAIRSGMHALGQARGDAMIGLVADLQDPPELIPALLAKWEEGFSMVLCVKKTSQENPVMFWMRTKYYQIVRRSEALEVTP